MDFLLCSKLRNCAIKKDRDIEQRGKIDRYRVSKNWGTMGSNTIEGGPLSSIVGKVNSVPVSIVSDASTPSNGGKYELMHYVH